MSRTLVLGGIRSGKSNWAETTIAAGTPAAVLYLATGRVPEASDASWAERVRRHRSRRPLGWLTVETTDVATQLRTDPHSATLVDDVGCWLTAALDRRGWEHGSISEDLDGMIAAVEAFAAPLVLVSPEVGLTVVPATAVGRRFADELGALNQRLAHCCERVVLIVAGQPLWIKPMGAEATR